MELPNSQNTLVTTDKPAGYLLSDVHPVGRSKAPFLKDLGYDETDVDIVRQQDIWDVQRSEYGAKCIIDGMIQTPGGATVAMRTVRIIEIDHPQPRLVTAYPL